MESVIALAVLVVLAIPVLLIVALASLSTVKRRLGLLEEELDHLRMQVAMQTPPSRAPVAPREPQPAPGPQVSPVPERMSEPVPPARPSADVAPAAAPAAPPATGPLPPRPPAPVRTAPQPGLVDVATRAIHRWFTVGNVPVKIGMLVLLAGVAALLKYASDQGWLHTPIEFRLAGIALAALAGLVFGWRRRHDKPAFALALQGGAIGVLLLTVFAAFKLYALLPAGAAFALSVLLVAGLGVLAVAQDSRTLAVLGVLAGFLAPIWLSTGGGSHVALFSYYAVLNAAIFAIAWIRPWRMLNLLGFVFTWGIGIAWGVLQYDPTKFDTTEPFLLLFYAFYLALPLLYARRQAPVPRDRIDGCLVFGTPLIAFSLQAGLLHGDRMPLALCALALGALYAVLAWWQLRRRDDAVLGQSHALLAAGFATLAVPLALSARATGAVFALEGAGVAWLGLRQGRRLPQWSGAALQLAAAVAFLLGQVDWVTDVRPVANATCMGALLIAVAGFASAWSYRRDARIGLVYYGWALLWWCGNAMHEVDRFVAGDAQADALLAFAAATGWLAAEVQRRFPARALGTTTLAAFVAAVPLAFAQSEAHVSPFAGNGAWAWAVFAALGVRSLICLRASSDRVAAWAQFVWWLVWPIALSLLAWQIANRLGLDDGWLQGLAALPWLVVASVALVRWPWLSAPQGERFDAYRTPLQAAFFLALALWWLPVLFLAASAAPLPWLPVFNPVELAQLAALVLFARWLWSQDAPHLLRQARLGILAAAGFILVTCMTLRAVHHWGDVAWDDGLLSSSLAQASLTVVWSVLGVIGWIGGSRRGQRALWLAGAVLMGVVLAKLVVVDRQHLGNLLGIGSFIAYGLLCTVVGYIAPAPPRPGASAPQEASA